MRAPDEHIEVFVAQLRNLSRRAFPTHDGDQLNAEIFRRLLAGIDPIMRSKALELNALTIQDVIDLVKNIERARQELQKAGLNYTFPYGMAQPVPPIPATLAAIQNKPAPSDTSNKSEVLLQELIDKVRSLELRIPSSMSDHQLVDRSRSFDRRRDDRSYTRQSNSRPQGRDFYNSSRSPSRNGFRSYEGSRGSNQYDHRPSSRSDSPYRYDQRSSSGAHSPFRNARNRSNSPFLRDQNRPYSRRTGSNDRNSREPPSSPLPAEQDDHVNLVNTSRNTQTNARPHSPYPPRSGDRSPSPYRRSVSFSRQNGLNG